MGRLVARKKQALVAVAVMGLTLFGFGVGPAYAANQDQSQAVTFTDLDGRVNNCQLLYGLDYDPSARQLNVYLFVEESTSSDTSCDRGPIGPRTQVDTTYSQNSDGRQVTNSVYGVSGAGALYNGVKNARIESSYFVTFYDCNVNVSTCSYSYSLVKPK